MFGGLCMVKHDELNLFNSMGATCNRNIDRLRSCTNISQKMLNIFKSEMATDLQLCCTDNTTKFLTKYLKMRIFSNV